MSNNLGNGSGNLLSDDKLKSFKNELADLLDKYGIDGIGLDYNDCSDTNGIYGESVSIFDWHGNGQSIGDGMGVGAKELRD